MWNQTLSLGDRTIAASFIGGSATLVTVIVFSSSQTLGRVVEVAFTVMSVSPAPPGV